MNIYLISQDDNNEYDTYDSAVVCAKDENEARMIHPGGYADWDGKFENYSSWTSYDSVKVKLIGTALENMSKGVICSSFNAG